MRHLATKILLLLFCCAMSPPLMAAWAQSGRLYGDAFFGMTDYRAEVAGVEAEKLSTMYEQVTVRYEKEDLIRDDRLGRYTLMLGYEFNAIDPERVSFGVNDASVSSITAQKLYYNASMLLAPGALPFRLTLFARDLHRTTFVDAGYGELPVGKQREVGSSGHLIDPDLPYDLSNGTRRQIGGTLLLGIRNGSYLGAYRDYLAQLPRFLADFKQEDIKDTSSHFSPQHNRNRDLAFVSLNKKDNWVHYRMRDYVDFLNPENNAKTSQIMIGTIDHTLNRKWIYLTNWIKISGDLSYTVEDEVSWDNPKQTYLLNLLLAGARQDMASSVMSNYRRETDGRFITSETNLPASVSINLNRDTRLRTRFIYEAREKDLFTGTSSSSIDSWTVDNASAATNRDLYLDNQLELRRSQRVIVIPRLEIEARNEASTRQGLALRAGSELMSNAQLNKAFNWLGGYAFTMTRSTDDIKDENGSFLQHELYGRVDKDLSRTWRVGGRSTLQTGSGKGREAMGFRIATLSGGLQAGTGNGQDFVALDYGGTITRGDLSLYAEKIYRGLSNRLELGTEFFIAEGVSAQQSYLHHDLIYKKIVHKLEWKSAIIFGDNTGNPGAVSFLYLQPGNNDDSTQASWNSAVRYFYDPSRSTSLTLTGAVSGSETDPRTIFYTVSEKIDYRIFTTNGIIRRIAEFSEELGYEQVSLSADGRDNTVYGQLMASYFPSKYIYGKVRSEIVFFLDSSALQQICSAEVGFNFQKLQLLASYSEANKERESASLPEIKEQRWDFKVKKIF